MTEAVASRTAASQVRPVRLLSDNHLMRLAVDGNQRAFGAIYRRYHQELYRYCLAILRSPEDARDALQSTMVNALRSLPGEKRQISLKPWLYRVAHNESMTVLRQRRPLAPLEDATEPQGPSANQQVEERMRLRELVADLGSLPERQRGAMVMRELSDLSYTEIGSAFETSSTAAKQTVYEARAALHEIAAGREMDCEVVREALSANDGRILRGRKLRGHLRHCADCRDFRAAIGQRRSDLASMTPPLPALAAAGLLHGMVGSNGGTVSGGVLGLLGGGGGKTLATSGALKVGAAVVASATIGVGTADVAGVVNTPFVGSSGSAGTNVSSSRGIPETSSSDPSGAEPSNDQAANANAEAGPAGKSKQSVQAKQNAASAQAPVSASAHGPSSKAHGSSNSHAGGPPNRVGGHRGHGQQKAKSHSPQLPAQAQSHPTHPAHPAHPSGKANPTKDVAAPKPDGPPADAPEVTPPPGHSPGAGKP